MSRDKGSHNVLILTQFFEPEGIGGGHRWKQIVERLPKNFKCHVACPHPSYPYGEFKPSWRPWERTTEGDVSVTRLWTFQPTKDSTMGRVLNYVIFSIAAVLYLLINFRRYDIVVTRSPPPTTFLPGRVAQLLGLNWILDVGDPWVDNVTDFGYLEEGSLAHRVLLSLERTAVLRSDEILVETTTIGEILQGKYDRTGKTPVTVLAGIDTEEFPTRPHTKREKRIIYTGNIGRVMAFEPFFQAFKNLSDEYNLTVVGSGEREEYLKRLTEELGIKDRVTFIGVVPRTEIPELLSTSLVSIIPLRTDKNLDYARPYKLVEAMASGTPYVASSLSEIERVSNVSNAGLTVENNPSSIEDALNQLLTDDSLRDSMGKNGIQFVRNHHQWVNIISTVSDAFRNSGENRVEG